MTPRPGRPGGEAEGRGVTRSAGLRSGLAARCRGDCVLPRGWRRQSGAARLDAPRRTRERAPILAWILGIAGLVAYNWWLLVPLKPGLMTSPDELFSNLEVSGQPYAAAMQHADLAAGLLLLAAFWAAGHGTSRAGRREWLSMLGFAAAGALGGLFPEVCADGVNAVCRRAGVPVRAACQPVHPHGRGHSRVRRDHGGVALRGPPDSAPAHASGARLPRRWRRPRWSPIRCSVPPTCSTGSAGSWRPCSSLGSR